MESYPYLYDADLWKTSLYITYAYNKRYKCYRMKKHSHPAIEIMYVHNGKCRIEYNIPTGEQGEMELREGQYVFLYSGIAHSLLIEQHTPCRIVHMEFITTPCGDEEASIYPVLLRSASFQSMLRNKPLVKFVVDRNGEMLKRMYDIHRLLYQNQQENSDAYTQDLLVELQMAQYQVLHTLAMQIVGGNQEENLSETYIRKIKTYITQNYDSDEKLSIAQIAENTHLSASHIQRLFKKETGMTILNYVNSLKTNKAKHLLETTDMTLVEIAICSGFGSRQQLNRIFTQTVGISPGKYRFMQNNKEFIQG